MELHLFLYFTPIILAILAFTPKIRKYLRSCWILRELPNVKEFPFFGYAFSFIGQKSEDFPDIFLRLTKDITSPTKVYVGPKPLVMIAKPEDIKTLGMTMGCVNKSTDYKLLRLPTSLAVVSADIWKVKRRLITPSFNVQVLETYLSILNDNVKIMTSNLHKAAQSCEGDFLKYTKYCLLENICETSLGYNIGVQSGRNLQFFEAVENFEKIITKKVFQFWYRFDAIYRWSNQYQEECKSYDIIINMVKDLIDQKKKEYHEAIESNGKPQVLINKLIKLLFDGNFTNQDVLDDVTTIIYGGYETCSTLCSKIMLMLAIHQDIQEKVLEEILTVNSNPDAAMTYEELGKLSYMEMVIKETLRLIPAAPILGRVCTKDVKLSNGVVPEGTNLLLLVCHMHRNESIWGPKCNDFYPEHFLPENVAKRHPHCYAAFGVGIRDCIGYKFAMIALKILLSAILKNFRVTIDSGTMPDLKLSSEYATQMKQVQKVRIVKRELL